MRLGRKQRLFISLLVFSIIIAGAYLFYHLNIRPKELNVILITIDALRSDHLGCYGYKRNTSSNIDKLAQEGVLFTQTIAQSSWTIPSLTSLMTSKFPRRHNVMDWGIGLDPRILTLAQILQKYDYYTAGSINVIKLKNSSELPFGKGFDVFIDTFDMKATKITQWARQWLKENFKRKFFLWLHYFEPHAPYRPSQEYRKMFIFDPMYQLNNKKVPWGNKSGAEYEGGWGSFPRFVVEDGILDTNYYIAQYDAEIRFTDAQIGLLLKEIKQLNLYNRTIIIITADHGESLGEHNWYFRHGISLYDTLIKVPLIIRFPYRHFNGNHIFQGQVQLVDLMPTILDMVNIDYSSYETDGRSFLPLLKNRLHSKGNLNENFAISDSGHKKSIRIDGWKLIYNFDKGIDVKTEYELYNLKNDPQEIKNLFSVEKDMFALLKWKLDKYLSQRSYQNSKFVLDEETKDRLRSLGYAE